MKKIGILTFHNSTNFGAILQNYALNRKMNELGNICETIDYECNYIINANTATDNCHSIKEKIKILYKIYKVIKCKKFVKKEIKLSKKFDKSNIHNIDYDSVIVGSDQVWNINCTGDDDVFFLNINCKLNKYSFAASIGLNDETCVDILNAKKDYLINFNSISLREKISDCSRLPKKIKNKIRYDLDPVFLLDSNDWIKLCNKKKKYKYKYKYIFFYRIGESNNLKEYAIKYAKKNNLVLIDNKKSLEFIKKCSPYDFLNWIVNAECIITNSFHATAFSIIFNKKFYVECNGKEGFNERINNLLTITKLEKQDIDNLEKGNSKIDFSYANKILTEKRNDSIAYLKNI